MPTHNVNLDALIPREDFEGMPDPLPPTNLGSQIKLNELEPSSMSYFTFRKPDFQRETASWEPVKVAEFVKNFLDGELIPSVILWRAPNGNIFVIDGAHRLSALIAWVHDDYGDGKASLQFFENRIPPEQKSAADRTRSLLHKSVGSYADVRHAGLHPANSLAERVTRARNMGIFAVTLQWVPGDAKKAEDSFFRINQQAAPIDPTELRMIKARAKPNALAARALIRAGVGHRYWSWFADEYRHETERVARSIYETLFVPPLETPIKTLDLPVAGRGYSADSVRLLFDFVNLANELRLDAQQNQLSRDVTGETTIRFLKNVRKIAFRISGDHPSSLGLHPAVYFYGATGRYQPTAFLAIVSLIKELERTDSFVRFTTLRLRFEEFLVNHRYFTNQIVSRFGSGLKGSGRIYEFYKGVLGRIEDGKPDEEIVRELQEGEFRFLKEITDEDRRARANFSQEVKSGAFLRDALDAAVRCSICGARIHKKSISVDHNVRKEDGGTGEIENAQLSHPYCNTGYKEGNLARAKAAEQKDLSL